MRHACRINNRSLVKVSLDHRPVNNGREVSRLWKRLLQYGDGADVSPHRKATTTTTERLITTIVKLDKVLLVQNHSITINKVILSTLQRCLFKTNMVDTVKIASNLQFFKHYDNMRSTYVTLGMIDRLILKFR